MILPIFQLSYYFFHFNYTFIIFSLLFFYLTGSLGMYYGCQFGIFMGFLSMRSRETVSIMPSLRCFSILLLVLPNTDGLFIALYYPILFYYYLLFYYYPIKVCFQMKDRKGSDGRGDKDLGWVNGRRTRIRLYYLRKKNIWFQYKEKNIKTPHYIPFTLKYFYIKIERHMYLSTKQKQQTGMGMGSETQVRIV